MVQHQFRSEGDGWPLVQLGPGVASLNNTSGYVWKDFEERIGRLITVLYDTYPEADKSFKINGLSLRYIDAELFDFEKHNVWEFIRDKLKVRVDLAQNLFEGTGVGNSPLALDLRFTFPTQEPRGATYLRFARGLKNGNHSLIWETQVQSRGEDVPAMRNDLGKWVESAHRITDDWFFKMIDGELLERYK